MPRSSEEKVAWLLRSPQRRQDPRTIRSCGPEALRLGSVCPVRKGFNPYNYPIVRMGCFDHQSYSESGRCGAFKFRCSYGLIYKSNRRWQACHWVHQSPALKLTSKRLVLCLNEHKKMFASPTLKWSRTSSNVTVGPAGYISFVECSNHCNIFQKSEIYTTWHHCLTVCPWKLWCLENEQSFPFRAFGLR